MGCLGCLGVLRVPIGAIIGYVTSVIAVGIGLAIVLSTQGAEFVFTAEGAWTASERFVLATLGIAALAGLLGGFVSGKIGGRGGLFVLLCVLASLGGLDALGVLPRTATRAASPERPEPRPEKFDYQHIAAWTDWPSWYRWANVGSGVVGAALGGAFAVGGGSRGSKRKRDDDRDE